MVVVMAGMMMTAAVGGAMGWWWSSIDVGDDGSGGSVMEDGDDGSCGDGRNLAGILWDSNMDEVKRHEDTFLNETYHDEVDIPEFDIEDTTDTDVSRTRPLVDGYESCNSVIKPKSYMDASKHYEWIDAMKAELEMIKKNNTWKLIDLPEGKNAIRVKWIYKIKFQPDRSIYKHKARLVVKSYSQVAGVDFGDAFSPVARHDTIKFLLAIAAQQN
ncbi:retrovirus-related pol polyprotein from transposon TNT 1-94 [Tanacetum coccineum]|uniref:Retrovirus-related pol polyprotein from transposon TNT 1-94 n=1 Tax=Tanacetum coccineum TaxID=301880 RepID=A0ABQ5ITV9_9ASTR